MHNSSSTVSLGFSVPDVYADPEAAPPRNLAVACKRTSSTECEVLPLAASTSLIQHDDDYDASSRPAKIQRSTMDADAYDSAVDPAATPQLHKISSQAGANSLAAGSCEATCRSYGVALNLKKPKITSACNSNIQPFAAAMPACADISLQLPSPDVPLHACPSPAACFAPTVDYPSQEVCMKLGSSTFAFGIAPVLQSDSKHVQASSPDAVGGPHTLVSSQFC